MQPFVRKNTTALEVILKYAKHPSISAIKKYNRTHHQFFISVVEKENIMKELQKLNLKKVNLETEIAKILKDNKDVLWKISKCSLKMQLHHLNFHHL